MFYEGRSRCEVSAVRAFCCDSIKESQAIMNSTFGEGFAGFCLVSLFMKIYEILSNYLDTVVKNSFKSE